MWYLQLISSALAVSSTAHATSNKALVSTPNHQLLPRQCAGTLCGWDRALCCPADTTCSTNVQNNAVCAPRDSSAGSSTGVSVASGSMSTSSLMAMSSSASSVASQATTTATSTHASSSAEGKSGSGSVQTMSSTAVLSTTPSPTPSTGGGGNVKGWSGLEMLGVVAAAVVL